MLDLKSVDKLVSTTINILKKKCICGKLCLQQSLGIVTLSYSKAAGILCFYFFMGWFNFISLFLRIRLFAVIWLMVHFYEGHECCLLNWKWKSLSLNQALRKTTSVSAGICSFVMPFYYAGSFGRITIWSFWNLEDVFKGKLCELVQLYFVRGI